MWFFGSSFFGKSNDGSDISPNQINHLIDSWETGSYDRAFLEDVSNFCTLDLINGMPLLVPYNCLYIYICVMLSFTML